MMIVDHELTPITIPLYDFIDDGIISRGKITMAIKTGKSLQMSLNFMEFIVLDNKSIYHRVLGRPVPKDFESHHFYLLLMHKILH